MAKIASCGLGAPEVSTARMLLPSSTTPSGSGTPAAASTVGKMSIVPARASDVLPGAIRPGQRAIMGTRIPPSHVVPFMPRRPPVLPPNQGPLSEVNTTSVF